MLGDTEDALEQENFSDDAVGGDEEEESVSVELGGSSGDGHSGEKRKPGENISHEAVHPRKTRRVSGVEKANRLCAIIRNIGPDLIRPSREPKPTDTEYFIAKIYHQGYLRFNQAERLLIHIPEGTKSITHAHVGKFIGIRKNTTEVLDGITYKVYHMVPGDKALSEFFQTLYQQISASDFPKPHRPYVPTTASAAAPAVAPAPLAAPITEDLSVAKQLRESLFSLLLDLLKTTNLGSEAADLMPSERFQAKFQHVIEYLASQMATDKAYLQSSSTRISKLSVELSTVSLTNPDSVSEIAQQLRTIVDEAEIKSKSLQNSSVIHKLLQSLPPISDAILSYIAKARNMEIENVQRILHQRLKAEQQPTEITASLAVPPAGDLSLEARQQLGKILFSLLLKLERSKLKNPQLIEYITSQMAADEAHLQSSLSFISGLSGQFTSTLSTSISLSLLAKAARSLETAAADAGTRAECLEALESICEFLQTLPKATNATFHLIAKGSDMEAAALRVTMQQHLAARQQSPSAAALSSTSAPSVKARTGAPVVTAARTAQTPALTGAGPAAAARPNSGAIPRFQALIQAAQKAAQEGAPVEGAAARPAR